MYTQGNEYKKDGKNYIGFYHIGDDGKYYTQETFMFGTSKVIIKNGVIKEIDDYNELNSYFKDLDLQSFSFNTNITITNKDIKLGYINRFFVQLANNSDMIYETNKTEYSKLTTNPKYNFYKIDKWYISGDANFVNTKNTKSLNNGNDSIENFNEYYNNPLEYYRDDTVEDNNYNDFYYRATLFNKMLDTLIEKNVGLIELTDNDTPINPDEFYDMCRFYSEDQMLFDNNYVGIKLNEYEKEYNLICIVERIIEPEEQTNETIGTSLIDTMLLPFTYFFIINGYKYSVYEYESKKEFYSRKIDNNTYILGRGFYIPIKKVDINIFNSINIISSNFIDYYSTNYENWLNKDNVEDIIFISLL